MARHGGYSTKNWNFGKSNGNYGRTVLNVRMTPGKNGKGGGWAQVVKGSRSWQNIEKNVVLAKGQTIDDQIIALQGVLKKASNAITERAAENALHQVQDEVMLFADEQYKNLFSSEGRGILTGNTVLSVMSAMYIKMRKRIQGLPSVSGKIASRRKLTTGRNYDNFEEGERGQRKRYIRVKSILGGWKAFPVDRIMTTSGGYSRQEAYQYLVSHSMGRDVTTKKTISGLVFTVGAPGQTNYVEGLDVYYNMVMNFAYNRMRETLDYWIKQETRAYRGTDGLR